MSQAETQQGFPKVPAQFVNADLTINEVWLRVLISLWNRTGGAPGASTNEALLWAISTEEMPRDADSGGGGGGGGSGGGFSSDVLFGGSSGSLDQQLLSPTALAEMPWTPPGDLLLSSLLEPAPAASSGSGNTTALTTNHIFVGNATNVATDVAMSGDATIVASGALTLANTAVTPTTYGDATHVAQVTIDSKGRTTAAANVLISGAGTASNTATLAVTISSSSTISDAAVGNVITPSLTINATGLGIAMTTVSSATIKFGIAPYDRATNKVTSAPTYTSVVTIGTGAAKQAVYANFASPVTMTGGSDYIIFMVRTDSTGSVSQTIHFASPDIQAPGLFLSTTVNVTAWQIANNNPGTGDTWSTGGGGVWSMSMVYSL